MQKDILAIILKKLVSIINEIIDCLHPNKEGKIEILIKITKNNLELEKYKECPNCGHALLSTCKVRGIKTINKIPNIPNH